MNPGSILANGASHVFPTESMRSAQASAFVVEPFTAPEYASDIIHLIRTHLIASSEMGRVLSASLRRVEKFCENYLQKGSVYLVVRDAHEPKKILGGAGLGPLHGLPPEEGVGELRDLVVDPIYREKGIGSRLLRSCLDQAKGLGYKRVYLETTPQMEPAQKLFLRFGFRPVLEKPNSVTGVSKKELPCYFVLEHLS